MHRNKMTCPEFRVLESWFKTLSKMSRESEAREFSNSHLSRPKKGRVKHNVGRVKNSRVRPKKALIEVEPRSRLCPFPNHTESDRQEVVINILQGRCSCSSLCFFALLLCPVSMGPSKPMLI